ncbi:lysoplasmalogenase [Shimia ponticola]|uniref:lysoplasmalogenase n=1 Tax=Shimia ponticola TaxID=2582893 RepID=UPI00164B8BE1|nr:lysoplasmalogenase [Shimia ponticola]
MASALGPVTSLIYWLGFSWRPASRAKTLAKALPMGILFGWLWVFADDVGDSPIPFAVMFAWLGDIALSKDGDRWFLLGIGAFALAHVFLIAVFFDLGVEIGAARIGGMIALVGLLGVMVPLLWRYAGDLRGPVMGYVAIIFAMGIAGLMIASGDTRVDQTVLLGLALFVLSDTLLALQAFVATPSPRLQIPLSLAVWPTYYLAMICFAAAAPG